ncbi:hypothetical protein H113_06635 [Trichophyton rubrum MR1459]|uniref:Uncharacterized protein n=1 Tax=Trichophyton rubrum (strain ATCC MYA-4607 / CBS 118892) TaxID=559305 RepID=A0A080WL05_TRIRC|nr:uncharacterized protein TERG_11777 [Trichophyton rubrum CBS 118892]EZF92586.1 hypothetical protein H113_06635 [Trichophyton rubrum MR1459]EZG02896.1 hypothetical protein H106_06431 [Trichophyton rubrum CBS 735.88]KFL60725.1 hypothetical protein TERG_11777 [Trichophyton rubrum CBS 118892]
MTTSPSSETSSVIEVPPTPKERFNFDFRFDFETGFRTTGSDLLVSPSMQTVIAGYIESSPCSTAPSVSSSSAPTRRALRRLANEELILARNVVETLRISTLPPR